MLHIRKSLRTSTRRVSDRGPCSCKRRTGNLPARRPGLHALLLHAVHHIAARNAGAPANTIKNKLAHVAVLLRWQDDRKRDLVDDFRCGRFLTVADVASLRDFAQRDMRDVGRADKRPRRPGVVLLDGRTARSTARPTVSGPQHYNRLTTIADYLAFVATVVTQHKASVHDAVQIERMVGLIRKHRPRGISRGFDGDPHTKSPPSDLIDRFMDVVAVDHPDNPFRDPGIRLRNAILFGLLRHTGIRRGELLSLRVGDMDVGHEPIVRVRRNHDDVFRPPSLPTCCEDERAPLPIPLELATQIQDYVLSHRAKIPGARRHGYLLVSHKKGTTFGQPLSLTALGCQIMGKVRSVDPAFADIHPHAFRHHFNYELSRRVSDAPDPTTARATKLSVPVSASVAMSAPRVASSTVTLACS